MTHVEFQPGYRWLRGYRAVVRAINCLADFNKTCAAREFYRLPCWGLGGVLARLSHFGGLAFGRLDIFVCRTQSGIAHVASHRAPAVAYHAAGAPHFVTRPVPRAWSVTARCDGSIHFAGAIMKPASRLRDDRLHPPPLSRSPKQQLLIAV
jgi:hypothetical protein